MKKFFLMLSSVFLFVGMVQAQDTQDTASKQVKQHSIQKSDRIHLEEHLIYQGGKLYWVQKGVRAEIKNQIMLNNGIVINPNGSYHLKIHKKYRLKDSECFDLNGNLYQNQEMFNRGRMIDKTEAEKTRSVNGKKLLL
jgi:hypothetical protein